MNGLSKNVINIIMFRLNSEIIYKLILIKPELFKNNEYFWRVIFFRIMKIPVGSWTDACELVAQRIVWYIRCYQCGYRYIKSLKVPVMCPICECVLDHRDTKHIFKVLNRPA